jgi:hypothetical protein
MGGCGKSGFGFTSLFFLADLRGEIFPIDYLTARAGHPFFFSLATGGWCPQPQRHKEVEMKEGPNAFRHFAEAQFQFSTWCSRQRDRARRHPQVSAAYLFSALVLAVWCQWRSLLEVDLNLRAPQLPAWVPRPLKRRGSDSTLARVLGAWGMRHTRDFAYALFRRLRQQGACNRTLSSGRVVRLAVVDGSCFGGLWACALGIAGAFWQTLDLERYAGRGKELPAARRLLDRAVQRLGVGFATHLLYDGLMAVKADFNRARVRWGMHLVVKTREQTLEVIQSCHDAWKNLSDEQLRALGAEVVRGTDAERGVEYVVVRQAGIQWSDLAWQLNVAWVRETPLKGNRAGQTETFWVLTTDETLKAEEMRELAHTRWQIENNGFKTLNAVMGSKRGYLKNHHARYALLLISNIGVTLRNAYEWWMSQPHGGRGWGKRITRRWWGLQEQWNALFGEIDKSGGSP